MAKSITEVLGIKYPIIQGGMAWISDAKLAAAVSNAGGAGIISCGGRTTEYVREEIRKAKQLTDKPFGVNVMLMAPNKDEIGPFDSGSGGPGEAPVRHYDHRHSLRGHDVRRRHQKALDFSGNGRGRGVRGAVRLRHGLRRRPDYRLAEPGGRRPGQGLSGAAVSVCHRLRGPVRPGLRHGAAEASVPAGGT